MGQVTYNRYGLTEIKNVDKPNDLSQVVIDLHFGSGGFNDIDDIAYLYIRLHTRVVTDGRRVQFEFLDGSLGAINAHYRTSSAGTTSTQSASQTDSNTVIRPTYYSSGNDNSGSHSLANMVTSNIYIKNMRSTSPVSRCHGYISSIAGATNNSLYPADCVFMLTEDTPVRALKISGSSGSDIELMGFVYHLCGNVAT